MSVLGAVLICFRTIIGTAKNQTRKVVHQSRCLHFEAQDVSLLRQFITKDSVHHQLVYRYDLSVMSGRLVFDLRSLGASNMCFAGAFAQ